MPRVIIPLLFCLLLFACDSKPDLSDLSGKWRCDVEATVEAMDKGNLIQPDRRREVVQNLSTYTMDINDKTKIAILANQALQAHQEYNIIREEQGDYLLTRGGKTIRMVVMDKGNLVLKDPTDPELRYYFTR